MPHPTPIFQKYQELFTNMLKCSANNSPRDSLNTQSGTMPLNYYQEHQHPYQEDSYVSHRTKLKKYQRLWQNIYQEGLSNRELDHMLRMSSLSRKRMASYIQYKITDLSING